jgi:hypothetical protein
MLLQVLRAKRPSSFLTEKSEYSLSGAKALALAEEAYFTHPSSDGNFVVY